MEIKKTKEASIDGSRMALVVVGMLFISSLVLASFSFKVEQELGDKALGSQRTQDAPVQQQDPNTPPPPPPQNTPQVDIPPPPTEETVEIENTEEEPKAVVVVTPPEIPIGPTIPDAPKKEIIEFPDVEAQFPGGTVELQKWIANNVVYPQTSIEMNEQGKVYLSFVVEEDGSITNVTIVKGVSTDLDREAKRLVKSMPKWVPGEAAGEKARTRCQIPINFTLN